jgi:hypothetical protein
MLHKTIMYLCRLDASTDLIQGKDSYVSTTRQDVGVEERSGVGGRFHAAASGNEWGASALLRLINPRVFVMLREERRK